MMKVNVLFARFPYGNQENPDCTDWLINTTIKAMKDPRIGEVKHWRINDTPITMGRNRCVKEALACNTDVLCMIDSDMGPDLPDILGAKPFWDTSFDFLLDHHGPCAIAAPYCGPPPFENVFIFQWASAQSDHPNVDLKLSQYTREQAYSMGGIQSVAALPTGLILIDMRVFARLVHPYFYYEYTDKQETHKASTEDVAFTRDMTLAGVPIYCNWDSWAGHWKWKKVGKPEYLTMAHIRATFREAIMADRHEDEKLIDLKQRNFDFSKIVNGQGELQPTVTVQS